MKKLITISVVLAVLAIGFLLIYNKDKAPKLEGPTTAFDAKNGTYKIDGAEVTLVDGESIVESAPGSASKTTTRYFGNLTTGDLNDDGFEDYGFLLTQETGGTGLFYYVVASLSHPDKYTTTDAFLLGDRIAPQTVEIKGGRLIANYADRKPGEPMTADPSVGTTKTFTIKVGDQLLLGK